MKRLLRDIVIAAAMVAALAIAVAIYLSVTTVIVRNATHQPLFDVKIGFTGKILWEGRLEPGSSKWTFGMPQRDGSVEISYQAGGAPYLVHCGYVSGGPGGGSFEIEVLPDGGSNCEENYK